MLTLNKFSRIINDTFHSDLILKDRIFKDLNISCFHPDDHEILSTQRRFKYSSSSLQNSDAIDYTNPNYISRHNNDLGDNNVYGEKRSEIFHKRLSKPGSGPRSETLSATERKKYVPSDFDFNFSDGSYWFDTNLWDAINSGNKAAMPKLPGITTPEKVKVSDGACIQKYTKVCKRLSRASITRWTASSREVAKTCGLTSSNGEIYFKTSGIDESINNTIKDSNSGFPYFRNKRVDVVIDDARNWLTRLINKPNRYSFFNNILMKNPQVFFHRYQPVVDDDTKLLEVKIRQVWCVPMRIVSLENYFFRNILDFVSSYNSNNKIPFMSSGFRNSEISDKIIRRMRFELGMDTSKDVFSLDYSKFDRSIPDIFIDIFYHTIKEHLVLSINESFIFDMLRFYAKYGTLAYGGKIYIKEGGVSSGLLVTNFIDSWINLMIIKFCESELFDEVNSYCVCGDDAILLCTNSFKNLLIDVCKRHGLILNVKCVCTNNKDPIFFLGRYWNRFSEPYQSELYMSSHIIFRSRFYKFDDIEFDYSKDLDPTRILSICCPLSNGYDYLRRTFRNFKPLNDFLMEKENLMLLKDYPFDRYQVIPISRIKDWRRF